MSLTSVRDKPSNTVLTSMGINKNPISSLKKD